MDNSQVTLASVNRLGLCLYIRTLRIWTPNIHKARYPGVYGWQRIFYIHTRISRIRSSAAEKQFRTKNASQTQNFRTDYIYSVCLFLINLPKISLSSTCIIISKYLQYARNLVDRVTIFLIEG